jgi:hypothetical protein
MAEAGNTQAWSLRGFGETGRQCHAEDGGPCTVSGCVINFGNWKLNARILSREIPGVQCDG